MELNQSQTCGNKTAAMGILPMNNVYGWIWFCPKLGFVYLQSQLFLVGTWDM
jgi:hypothetical protein